MKTQSYFGKLSSLSTSMTGDVLAVFLFKSAAVNSIAVYVSPEEARGLCPGDEIRIDITKTGFTERSAAALEAGTLGVKP